MARKTYIKVNREEFGFETAEDAIAAIANIIRHDMREDHPPVGQDSECLFIVTVKQINS